MGILRTCSNVFSCFHSEVTIMAHLSFLSTICIAWERLEFPRRNDDGLMRCIYLFSLVLVDSSIASCRPSLSLAIYLSVHLTHK